MVKDAKRRGNPYDCVWLFFDNDNQPNMNKLFETLKNSPIIKISYSGMCIEHWFILHLKDNRRPYQSSKEVQEELNKLWQQHFKQAYHKTKINHYEKLQDKLDIAIKRSIDIKTQAETDNIPIKQRNPYFTVQEFINFIRNL